MAIRTSHLRTLARLLEQAIEVAERGKAAPRTLNNLRVELEYTLAAIRQQAG